ncbi:hypothetical protein [Microcoleus sp. Pol12A5]|uniref:hypothetical protein n=1 Tax=Microcoleus sp. Pol12A5 TaxID=3055392 RepID=UPI002FD3FF38
MAGVAGRCYSSTVPSHKGFRDMGKKGDSLPFGNPGAIGIAGLHEIFDRYVKIFEIWCNIRKRQISDVTAA